jgi:hypothetical protein
MFLLYFNIDFLRRILGERFADWFELIERVMNIRSALKTASLQRLYVQLLFKFELNFKCDDFFFLCTKIKHVEPRLVQLVQDIFSMIHQVVMDQELQRFVAQLQRRLPDAVPPIPGTNPIIFTQRLWIYLSDLDKHLLSCQPVPQRMILPIMYRRKKVGFSVLPLEISISCVSILRKRYMKLLCLSGCVPVLVKRFFRGDRYLICLYFTAIQKTFGTNFLRRLLKQN